MKSKIKRNYVTRILAMLLCIVMTVNSLSLEAFAADETSAAGSTEAVPVMEGAEGFDTVPEAHIVAEVEEERTLSLQCAERCNWDSCM